MFSSALDCKHHTIQQEETKYQIGNQETRCQDWTKSSQLFPDLKFYVIYYLMQSNKIFLPHCTTEKDPCRTWVKEEWLSQIEYGLCARFSVVGLWDLQDSKPCASISEISLECAPSYPSLQSLSLLFSLDWCRWAGIVSSPSHTVLICKMGSPSQGCCED